MKIKFYTTIVIFSLHVGISFAGFIDGTFKFDNKVRKFSIYVPNIYYTQNKPVPLLVGLHGFGDEISSFKNICMSGIADTANYICAYAEALPDPVLGANAWNSGAAVGPIVVNNTAKDNGFINALVDSVIKNYMIDTTRMYVFGFSFGAFMTDRLAAENTNRFAAVANVSGLRGNAITALPSRGMPYLKFHGTNDATISYNGASTLGFLPGLGLSAENTVKFWVTQNNCDATPIVDTMPDIANDGKRFVRFTYNNGKENSKVVFYKVINGEHSWYGTPASDISYCQTIWSFFRQFSRTRVVTSIKNQKEEVAKISIYPNPSNGSVTIDFAASQEKYTLLRLYSITGEVVYTRAIDNELQIVLDNKLAAGMYVVSLTNNDGVTITQKLVIQ